MGLYLHIPFCKSKCRYCDFYSLPQAEERMDGYVRALEEHLLRMSERAAGYTVDTIYFGGGTPSYLGWRRLTLLLEAVLGRYRVAPGAEITLEANPDSLNDAADVRELAAAGFNRVSLGVQSADDGELRAIGRIHTFAQAAASVEAIRAGGIGNLSLDLMYGLPDQTMERWQGTMERTLALGPEHLSCYGLKLEEGTPLWRRRKSLTLPDEDLQADLYLWTVERLKRAGYGQYEISNFARTGRASRHNEKYWALEPYLGFGPGAHSDFGGVRYAYARSLEDYCRGVETGEPPLRERMEITRRERAPEYVMLGLRTARGVCGGTFEERYGMSFAPVRAALEPLTTTGHVTEEEDRWRLTPTGFLVSNQIIGRALEALETSE